MVLDVCLLVGLVCYLINYLLICLIVCEFVYVFIFLLISSFVFTCVCVFNVSWLLLWLLYLKALLGKVQDPAPDKQGKLLQVTGASLSSATAIWIIFLFIPSLYT